MPWPKRAIPDPSAATRALREFVATEVAGGIVLVAAACVALVWANSPWQEAYRSLWETELSVALGSWSIDLDLRHWVNDGLMAIFFVVVGMEVKRELVEGELREPRRAALPVIAAIGGMVLPALLYLALNRGGDGGRGWGIPMATDIAFALGVAALVARGLPSALRLFLLTLAIVDDIGAILVIALFYSGGVEPEWLVAAVLVLAAAYGTRRLGIVFSPVYVVFGVGLWLALYESGVHPTLAGVAMGLLVPVQPTLTRQIVSSRADEMLDVFSPEAAQRTRKMARLSVSEAEWLQHELHPWTSLLIVPMFALANAGVSMSAEAMSDAIRSPVTWGVVLGLVVGKTVGISGLAWAACRLGIAELPSGARWSQLVGVAALAGIGFTVSLFITGLAFSDPGLVDQAKMGILAASLLASGVGAGVLLVLAPRAQRHGSQPARTGAVRP
jgi:NhaA family Na+:H+ antiporter